MLGLSVPSRSGRTITKRRRACLAFEALESRLCPTLGLGAALGTLTLQAEVLGSHQIQIVGHLAVEVPAAFSISLSGAVSGSITPDVNGNFTYCTDDATLGSIYALATGPASVCFGAEATIALDAPTITLELSYLSANSATLSGVVTGIDAGAQTVVLTGGFPEGMVEVDVDANGAFTFNASFEEGGLIEAVTTDLWGQASNTAQTVFNTSLEASLDVSVLTNRQVQLSGIVIGDNVGGLLVTFSGAFAGTTYTDEFGCYNVVTSEANLGAVYAVVSGGYHFDTNPLEADIVVSAPTITFTITDMTADTVTLSGTLTSLDIVAQTIAITGCSMTEVLTDAQGNFTFTLDRAGLETIAVSETDLWGQTSNNVAIDVANAPPFIRSFTGVKNTSQNTWTFNGQVIGDDVVGLLISLGGISSLLGQSCTVDSSGWFTFEINVTAGQTGYATAQTTQEGQASNEARYYVNNE